MTSFEGPASVLGSVVRASQDTVPLISDVSMRGSNEENKNEHF